MVENTKIKTDLDITVQLHNVLQLPGNTVILLSGVYFNTHLVNITVVK